MEGHQLHAIPLRAEIPVAVKHLLEDLKLLQAQIDALPGPRLHQDHDFTGGQDALDTLHSWLNETAWVPYWGQPDGGDTMLLLGGRDPWIETLELRLWSILEQLADAAGCELSGRGAVSPKDVELRLIHVLYPELAEANGWVFSRQGNVVQ
ncbi:MAG: hypothetical protein EON60_06440 [Alphaproteobacteria bacterium]|nr:MAG: hypothetical protein EON60_06440 [Alphaproteobacteria bacterium]